MNNLSVKIKSNGPMLMNGDKLADPLHPATKAHKVLTSKRTKTDEDLEAIAHSKYIHAFYYNEEAGIHLPTMNIRKSLVEGARLNKQGKNIERGVVFLDHFAPLSFEGPDNPQALWDHGGFMDARTVVVRRNRVMTYRPMFREWSVEEVNVIFDPNVINEDDLLRSWTNAGMMIGIGDYRPDKGGIFGRYFVEKNT